MNPPSMPYFFPTTAGLQYSQDGGGTTHSWLPDSAKSNQQYPASAQWDNSFHVTGGNNYGPGAVQVQGGGQNRVQVGPQPPQQLNQPPPTSTPPNIHGDMSKQPNMQNQPAQISFVNPPRQMSNPSFQYPRGSMTQQQQPRIQPHNRAQIINNYMLSQQGVLAPTPPQAIVSYPTVMYPQPRQGNITYPTSTQFLQQQLYYNPHPAPPFYQQVIPPQTFPGPPAPQPSTPQQSVPMLRPSNIVQPAAVPPGPSAKQEIRKRTKAVPIIDPDTLEEISYDSDNSRNNNITPTRSNESSARETPQPNAGVSTNNVVAADFAARVAAIAIDEPNQPQSSPETVKDTIPVSISESDLQHKQSTVVPSSEKVFNPSSLSTTSEEFYPRSVKSAQPSEISVEETRTPIVPTVSAETNSPAFEIQRPKEQFPALKNPMVPSASATASPMRVNSKKQKGNESEWQQIASATQAPTVSQSSEIKEFSTIIKKGQKSNQKEDSVPQPQRKERSRNVLKDQSPSPSPDRSTVQLEEPEKSAASQTKEVKSSITPQLAASEDLQRPTSQHQNGETAVPDPSPSVDGSKSRQRNKKGGNKMRELNRRGVEKEGSEMDAFTTEPTIVSEERPETPVSPPPQSVTTAPLIVPETVSAPAPAPATTPLPSSAPIPAAPLPQDDLAEKEEKLVAAKNEENTKVSALSNPEEVVPVIEKSVPQLTLKRSYKKDQWSPLNPDGRKKYERDFLLELKSEPHSNIKPENLPDVKAVLRDDKDGKSQSMNYSNRGGEIGGLMPSFLRNSQSQRAPPPKRGSQQGPKGKGNPKVIHVSLSLHEDVKLRTAENAWKPNRLTNDGQVDEDEKQTEELYKNVRGILNKLTPQKFDKLMEKFLTLPINSEKRLTGVIDLIFQKAVDEPNFSKAYANMCKTCSKIEITKSEKGQEQKVNFRKLLITRCQNKFESNKPEEMDAKKWADLIKNCTDPEKKKELQLEYEEKERQIRMKSVGNIRFIGELFKLQMLTPNIMYRCIEHLLKNPEEESLECLCKLLTTIGQNLETSSSASNPKAQTQSLNPYFQTMSELAQKKDGSKISSRVRFMLQDVIELRQHKWVPRREDNNPKTIDQITKEAERESYESKMALNQPPPRLNRQNDRPDDRRKGRTNQNEDGWVNVTRHYTKSGPAFEASKMQNMGKLDLDPSVSLGGSQMFRFSSAANKMESKSSPFTSNNAFSALSRGDDRKPPPQPYNNNRRITPTPSIEKDKERQRMIQDIANESGRGSRGNSVQRERPQPPSRDSSTPRQLSADNKESERTIAPTLPAENKTQPLTGEKLERQTISIFDEYFAGVINMEDVRQEIAHFYPGDTIGGFVSQALSMSLEMKAGAQKSIGVLLAALMDNYVDYNLYSPKVFVEQLAILYTDADDISIDIPKFWELQAQVLVPIISAEKMDFSHFKTACSSVLNSSTSAKLLLPILSNLVKEKGAGFVRKVWDSSNVSLKDFIPSDENVDAFIKTNSLEYLTGEPPKYESSTNQILMDQVREKMLRLMQTSQPFEKILDFISTNIGDKTGDLQFICALTTAICEASTSGSGSNHNLDPVKFKQYEKLIQRFVDNKEDRELACLNAVHNLSCKRQHPQGLIKNIFNLLLDNGLISSESFLKWRDDDSEKLENKGVSKFALTSFFMALEEADTDDDNS